MFLNLEALEAGQLLAAGGSPPVRCMFRAFVLLQFINEFVLGFSYFV